MIMHTFLGITFIPFLLKKSVGKGFCKGACNKSDSVTDLVRQILKIWKIWKKVVKALPGQDCNILANGLS